MMMMRDDADNAEVILCLKFLVYIYRFSFWILSLVTVTGLTFHSGLCCSFGRQSAGY